MADFAGGPETPAVEKAIADVFANSGLMLTRMVLVTEHLDGDGERTVAVIASDELRTWDIAGMLRCASVSLDTRMAAEWMPADGGED